MYYSQLSRIKYRVSSIQYRVSIMSIENLTLSAAADLAHFRHFSSFFTKVLSTLVENPLQIDLFMQNKPKVKNAQINVSSFITSKYVKVDIW
jgi:hypothetical protein